MYFKEHLPLIRGNDLSILQECLVTEVIVDKEKCFFTCIYRSPNLNHEELENFNSNFHLLLSNINDNHPTCSILIGDFNAKSSRCCNSDKSIRASEELDSITKSAGYSQLINQPTHFVNKTSSCINLIFSSDLNITKNCGIEKTIHEKCHHDIIYGTLNLNVPLPPPYYREIWDYKHANTENIQKDISMFDWQKAFKNKNTNEMTRILTDTLMNIFKNFIPH